MSIIGITSASGIPRIEASASDAAATAVATRASTPNAIQTEQAEDTPKPVRFPWLSRLSADLEAASNKRAPFSTPITGDNLNKQA